MDDLDVQKAKKRLELLTKDPTIQQLVFVIRQYSAGHKQDRKARGIKSPEVSLAETCMELYEEEIEKLKKQCKP